MFGIISAITALANPVGAIIGQIADARAKAEMAASAAEKIEADERVAALEIKRDVLIALTASPGWWVPALMRGLLAMPFVLYFWVVIFFGRTLEREWAVVSDLSSEQWRMAWIIIGFYFASDAIARWRR